MPKLAEVVDQNPAMLEVIRDMFEGIERFASEHGLDLNKVAPSVKVTPDGKCIIDLYGDQAE